MAPSAAEAYRTTSDLEAFSEAERVIWAGNELVFVAFGTAPDDIGEQALTQALHAASDRWWHLDCGGPRVTHVAITSRAPKEGDGVNTIAWVDPRDLPDGLRDEAPAITRVQYRQEGDGPWVIVEADIYLDRTRDWSPASGGDGFALDIVVSHELGHALGLLHPCEEHASSGVPACDVADETALMHPRYDFARTEIGPDDRAGYCFLYRAEYCATLEIKCAEPMIVPDAGTCIDCEAEHAPNPMTCGGEGDGGAECRNGDFGEACESHDECASLLCVSSEASSAVCTRTCSEDIPCPSGWYCDDVDGRSVCLEQSQGCAVALVQEPSLRRSYRFVAFDGMILCATLLALRTAASRKRTEKA